MTSQAIATHLSLDPRDCAAEELALRLGWLRECPYHGEPFKAAASLPTPADFQRGGVTPRYGYGADVLALAATLSSAYADGCPLCAREDEIPE